MSFQRFISCIVYGYTVLHTVWVIFEVLGATNQHERSGSFQSQLNSRAELGYHACLIRV